MSSVKWRQICLSLNVEWKQPENYKHLPNDEIIITNIYTYRILNATTHRFEDGLEILKIKKDMLRNLNMIIN